MRRDVVLMIDHRGKVHAVNEAFEQEKKQQYGWLLVARDADVYTPDAVTVHSNPRRERKKPHWWMARPAEDDGA